MIKVLICGATGFIGRNLAEHFAKRDDLQVYGVHFKRPALDNPSIIPLQADLTRADEVDRVVAGMDVIIQAAASTSGARDIIQRPYIHVTDNAIMNSLLLRAAYEHAAKQFIYFSCSVMYPSAELPLLESDFDPSVGLHPRYFGVGWTKVYGEKMCEFYGGLGRTKHTIIRQSNIFGPHDKYDLERSHVFGATMTKVMQSQGEPITVWGNGTEARDLLYVDDLVNFVELAMDRQQSLCELVNVGSGEAVSVRDLVEMIIATSGKALDIKFDLTKPNIDTHLCLDTSRARDIFGWEPRTSLSDAIRRTMDWYKANLPHHAGSSPP